VPVPLITSVALFLIHVSSTPDVNMPGTTCRDQELDDEKAERAQQEVMHHGKLSAAELEIEKRLLRKIDIRIMPLVILVYLMNYIDR
jgi:hypothetical protein